MKLYSFIVVISFFITTSYFAQEQCDTVSVCKCTQSDLTPAGVMISHQHPKGSWMLSYRYMNINMEGLQNTSKNEVFVNYLMAPEKMQMNMHMLMAMYGVTNKLTAMAMFNYNATSMDMSMFNNGSGNHVHNGHSGNSNAHTMKNSGLGDIKLYALYTLHQRMEHLLLLSMGASLPTGSINNRGGGNDMMYADQRLPYTMQLGSGTTDILPGISYVMQQSNATFSAQLLGVYRTSYNNKGYKLGNEIKLNTWFAYKWLGFLSSSARLEGAVSEKIAGNDPSLYYFNEPSANPYNYGGKTINCFVGSVFHFSNGVLQNTRLAIEYGMPVYQHLNGIQMNNKQTINASLSVIL